MPSTIDEEKFASQKTLDLSKPQGTAQGLPVKHIAHQEYPRCAYRHPVVPYREELHRNAQHEIVHRELVATEHKVHVCHTKAEFEQKLKEGYVAEPYIPQAPPDPTEHLYETVANEVEKRAERRNGGRGAKANTDAKIDPIAAQKLLLSRGYTCDTPADADIFFAKLAPEEQASFLMNLAEAKS